ncbi:MAG TPA: formyltransferase family protein [Blastocatellia bacterium]|jgi:methionyl-tRNA formyltransferase
MRLVILTSKRRGIASRCLPALDANPNLSIAAVIWVRGEPSSRKRSFKRKLKKIWKIGLLGALNGIRMRKWYADLEAKDLESVAHSLGIPFIETPTTNCEETRKAFREAQADLGLSLGNGYIAENVFTIPRLGMINSHGEILPRFRGAQSVIWPIYEGCKETGFTFHQIDKRIDSGAILHQEKYPIVFYPTLRETVEKNIDTARRLIPERLSFVCEHYEEIKEKAACQQGDKSYTTPSFRQFLRMWVNNRKFCAESRSSQTAEQKV